MDSNKKCFTKFVKEHKGELCLELFRVVRLEDFAEDDEDYYWVITIPNWTYEKPIWSSCVGSLTPLKGKLSEDEYVELERVFNLNTWEHWRK